jgi:hypothetical protein
MPMRAKTFVHEVSYVQAFELEMEVNGKLACSLIRFWVVLNYVHIKMLAHLKIDCSEIRD